MKNITTALGAIISGMAKSKGARESDSVDYNLPFEDFKFRVYNTACLGCSRRISPPSFVRRGDHFIMVGCRKSLKRCPGIKMYREYHKLHKIDNSKEGVNDER